MRPSSITNDTTARTLTVTWGNGRVQDLTHSSLRAACKCAFCRAKQLSDNVLLDDQLQLISEVHAHGYGLQLVFNDGHDRGMYPWQYLQTLN